MLLKKNKKLTAVTYCLEAEENLRQKRITPTLLPFPPAGARIYEL